MENGIFEALALRLFRTSHRRFEDLKYYIWYVRIRTLFGSYFL